MASAEHEQLTLEQGQLPWTVVIAISAVGGVLLVLNALLIVFFVRRRRQRTKNSTIDSASTSDTSTKSEAAHMYGANNDSASSPSVNSCGSFSRGDSLEECATSATLTPTRTNETQEQQEPQQFWFRSDQRPVVQAQYSFAHAPPFSQPAGHFPYL
ncbi:hypothetical protein FJT64_026507 [Amphibalanus amphitrite]|uniref:Epidermal growth factor receptor-like transmembrane-juxtamembrane segment domain-containing protein n=1 Tax=Amphibalanus amphitrite TaxID=1232801 RepID=A0A6A4W400_AMPAM|nr:hypothetical protein FJT64_026507 [Amphibalanus amphitrite]